MFGDQCVPCASTRLFATAVAAAMLAAQSAGAAETPARATVEALSSAGKSAQTRTGLAAFAKSRGFSACASELDTLDQNLLRDSEYSLRVFLAESDTNSRPLSAVIDSRKADQRGGYTRALTNIVVTPGDIKIGRCTTMYEQTLFHDQHCDLVKMQMAPGAKEAGATSFGSITYDLLRNMTLTIIPVGRSQCVTVLKEVAY